ncbi:GTPase ERA-like, chloroplastic [Lotus japonicus]|uniref:GTPase ERA-like, chloroplastic n=1 Tax=Lotus japonicus TaxID=34305 RepID=UPI00258848BE|nr:GTPase ERA-like, chloroplastic [Lotus japonicus]XP_057417227.1 GTPase ERA-like, chloroplastic [Lotus japonicus]
MTRINKRRRVKQQQQVAAEALAMETLAMRAASAASATVPQPQFSFQLQHSLFPVHGFTLFHRNRTDSPSHLCCRTRHRHSQPFANKQHHLVLHEEPQQQEEEEDEEVEVEEEEASYSDDDTSFLSLTVKPDRNMALLDDYETEELDFDDGPNHRSGYVALLGKPNVGKSTLANQMVGQKLSIVTDKPQTTRHRILCICSGTDYQMVLYDTPGVLQKEMHKLDSMMMKNVRSAAVNADCVLVLVDACKAPEKIDELLEEGIGDLKDKPPVLLILNKKDLIKPGEVAKKLEWYEKFTNVDEVIPVSAKYGHGVADVKDWILSKLPNGPSYYPKDIVSEHPERFFVAEIVREKIFMQYRNEIPYACQVNVVSYKARPNAKDFIQVEILVEKNSQKMIVIGREGKALKLLATASRLDIEDFLQKKVYLEIEVKVRENWRQDEGLLKDYGYGGQIRVL